ncbi:MAG: hypothetical protein N2378_12870 [Chloroflexaceae bacterium]|nr:hypothetical protein [Chloroflexaceae bacterium]
MPGDPAHLTGGGNSLISSHSRESILCFLSLWSILSIGSVGSILSIGSAGSILSFGGRGRFRGRPVRRAGAIRQ